MALPLKKKLGFALATTVLVLGIVEVVLRITTRELGKATIPSDRILKHVEHGAMKYDPVYGWVRAQLPLEVEGINKDQFRYRDLPTGKTPGTWRAFTMGDSQTYGAGVAADQTYSAWAERTLRAARPDRTIEVVNTGTSGYGSLQALRLMRHKLPAWKPDLYIVDCFVHDQPRDERVPVSQRFPTIDRLLFHWRTWYVLRYTVEKSRGRLFGPRNPRSRDDPAYHSEWMRAGRDGNHDLIVEEAERQGVDLLFVDYPVWKGPADVIECEAEPEDLPAGVHVAHVCEALRDSGLPARDLFFDRNHLREAGNEIAGRTLARTILDLGLLP
ncbi:MAG: SGNH/GDSL hydrolase family protein [Deltaproteobacteria bacterium]|nr:MAG: SGNH/GDSL hydrolase family protein [Deltaproteobacteria bacterium]